MEEAINYGLIIRTNLTVAIDKLVEEVRWAIWFKEHSVSCSKCLATILNSLDIRQNHTLDIDLKV
jgi:hypothetical protein